MGLKAGIATEISEVGIEIFYLKRRLRRWKIWNRILFFFPLDGWISTREQRIASRQQYIEYLRRQLSEDYVTGMAGREFSARQSLEATKVANRYWREVIFPRLRGKSR